MRYSDRVLVLGHLLLASTPARRCQRPYLATDVLAHRDGDDDAAHHPRSDGGTGCNSRRHAMHSMQYRDWDADADRSSDIDQLPYGRRRRWRRQRRLVPATVVNRP